MEVISPLVESTADDSPQTQHSVDQAPDAPVKINPAEVSTM